MGNKIKDSTVITQVKPCVDVCMLNVKEFLSKDEIYANSYYLSLDEAVILQGQLNDVIALMKKRELKERSRESHEEIS